MRKTVFIIMILMLAGLSFGCGKKQQSLEEMQQPMSMETLVTMSTSSSAPVEQKMAQPQSGSTSVLGPASESSAKLDPLPPAGPYKPTAFEIQTALQNANFYTGSIDGKIGPVSKKAIVEFQKANNLVADGKVGPKTWSVLGKYLKPLAQEKVKAQ